MEIYKLTNETIDMLSDKIGQLYVENKKSTKETLRGKLLLEEALLKYQSRFGSDVEIYCRTINILAQTRFTIRIRSASFDPFSLEENPMAFMIQSITSTFEDTLPSWRYRNLENELVFTIKSSKQKNSNVRMLASVGLFGVLAVLLRLLLPNDSLIAFCNNYVDPLANAYAGMFGVMAVILIFCALVLSIVKIGDINILSNMGGSMLRRFFIIIIFSMIIISVPVLPLFDIHLAGSSLELALSTVYDIIIGFLPGNLVGAFLNFNSVHIMLIGCMFGFSLLAMGQKADVMVRFFDEANTVAILTNNFLNKFIAIYAGFKLFTIIAASDFVSLLQAGRMVVCVVIAQLVIFVVAGLRASKKQGISFFELFRALMPSFIICLSSANFGAAFSTIFDNLMDLKADEEITPVALNVGSILFKPSTILSFVFASLFMAKAYGLTLSVVWVITAALLSLILVLGVPNIPGATVGALTMLFSQLALPSEALSLMIAVYAIMQFFNVAVDTWALECEIVVLSKEKVQKKN